jgi:hypothetical protein
MRCSFPRSTDRARVIVVCHPRSLRNNFAERWFILQQTRQARKHAAPLSFTTPLLRPWFPPHPPLSCVVSLKRLWIMGPNTTCHVSLNSDRLPVSVCVCVCVFASVYLTRWLDLYSYCINLYIYLRRVIDTNSCYVVYLYYTVI